MENPASKVKLFRAYQQDIAMLEDEINQWLAENSDTQIIHMAQSEICKNRGWDIIVTFLYKKPADI